MLCRDIIDAIERTYPKQAAMEWDNVGLLVGRTDKEVKKIYVTVDLDEEAIDHAISNKVDMIVTHHPLIFAPLKKVTNEHFIGNRVVKLLQHDISYYAMHTNYDVIRMAELSGEMIGLQEAEEIESGIGRIGKLQKDMTLEECCAFVKEKFNLDTVKVFGDKNKVVKLAAICPGSGSDMIKASIVKGADVLITGDINHHYGIDAVAQNLAIIDAGHYGLEHIFIEDMASYLREHVENVAVEAAEILHPFEII